VRIHDIMTVDLITVPAEATLREVAELFSDEHISGAPVLESGKVVGVISATDLLEFDAESRAVPTAAERGTSRATRGASRWTEEGDGAVSYFADFWDDAGEDVSERFGEPDGPEWNVLEEHTAGELMTRQMCTLSPNTDLQEASAYMLRYAVHRVLVVDEGRVIGLLSTTDILKAVSQHGVNA